MGKQNEIAVIRFQYGAGMRGVSEILTKPEQNKEELNNCMHANFSNSTKLQSVLNIFTSVFRGFHMSTHHQRKVVKDHSLRVVTSFQGSRLQNLFSPFRYNFLIVR